VSTVSRATVAFVEVTAGLAGAAGLFTVCRGPDHEQNKQHRPVALPIGQPEFFVPSVQETMGESRLNRGCTTLTVPRRLKHLTRGNLQCQDR